MLSCRREFGDIPGFCVRVTVLNLFIVMLNKGLCFVFWIFFRYEMAEECADDDDAKAAIFELKKGVLEAIKMHDSVVQVSF